ncbi:MAG: helix-hairpin-helix domain-containing protein [Sellimonas sp.]|uniref:helix-hairpin-helix domain-containing protein n=1 Tax=Sellimonas sp. TaxID=2021466 RepID=UPI0039A2090D
MQKKRIRKLCLVILVVLIGMIGCGKKGGDSLREIPVSDQEETPEEEQQKDEAQADTDDKKEAEENTKEENLVVYVCGEVRKPGVVELPNGSRIYEAIEKAGGMTEKASASYLNQAEILKDGAKVYVPSSEEADALRETKEDGAGSQAGGQKEEGKVNLNEASREELMTLPGVGEAKADSILSYREENGGFDSIEEIMEISGIKEGVFEKMKDKITV